MIKRIRKVVPVEFLLVGAVILVVSVIGSATFGRIGARTYLEADAGDLARSLVKQIQAEAVVRVGLRCEGRETATETRLRPTTPITRGQIEALVPPGCDLAGAKITGWWLVEPQELSQPTFPTSPMYRRPVVTAKATTDSSGKATVTVVASARAGWLGWPIRATETATYTVVRMDQAESDLWNAVMAAAPIIAARVKPGDLTTGAGTVRERPQVQVVAEQPKAQAPVRTPEPAAPAATPAPSQQTAAKPQKPVVPPRPDQIFDMEKIRKAFGEGPQR